MSVKKIIIGIVAIIVVFTAGFIARGIGTTREVAELESRAVELESKLIAETERASEITKQLDSANREIAEITNSNRIITDENKRITKELGNIGAGITEDQNRISDIITELDFFIEKGTE